MEHAGVIAYAKGKYEDTLDAVGVSSEKDEAEEFIGDVEDRIDYDLDEL